MDLEKLLLVVVLSEHCKLLNDHGFHGQHDLTYNRMGYSFVGVLVTGVVLSIAEMR